MPDELIPPDSSAACADVPPAASDVPLPTLRCLDGSRSSDAPLLTHAEAHASRRCATLTHKQIQANAAGAAAATGRAQGSQHPQPRKPGAP